MDTQTISFAVAAGSVAALNPCGFAMLPAYLSLVVLDENPEGQRRIGAVGRALAATAAMALGFLLVFGAFGLVIGSLVASAGRYQPVGTVIIGGVLVGLGVWMLTGREIWLLLPKARAGAPTAHLASMFGYGLAYAFASLSCTIGPFLAVTGATFRSGSILAGVLAYLAYAAGMALVVGVAATAVALAGTSAMSAARRILPYVNRFAGVLLVLVGGYVTYYGAYELQLNFGGDSRNPLIDAATRIQSALANSVAQIGAWPMLAILMLLVLTAVILGRRIPNRSAKSARRAPNSSADEVPDRR